jgi:predicted integral membrane protein DUF2269
MEYGLLKFFHLVGAILMGGGLIGVWMADLRSRQLHELKPFSEAVRNIAVFYDGLVVPGALLLLASGSRLLARSVDPPIADMGRLHQHVGFGPLPDSCNAATMPVTCGNGEFSPPLGEGPSARLPT